MDTGGEDQQMDFDAVVSKLYAEVREHDPANLILKERLDEKGGMLMDGEICYGPVTSISDAVELMVCQFSSEYATTEYPPTHRNVSPDNHGRITSLFCKKQVRRRTSRLLQKSDRSEIAQHGALLETFSPNTDGRGGC